MEFECDDEVRLDADCLVTNAGISKDRDQGCIPSWAHPRPAGPGPIETDILGYPPPKGSELVMQSMYEQNRITIHHHNCNHRSLCPRRLTRSEVGFFGEVR